MKILYITNNEKRVKALKDVLKQTMEISTVDFLFDLDYELKETEYSQNLEKNAYKKARLIWRKEKEKYDFIIAEDYGLFSDFAPNILGITSNDWWPGTQRDKNEALIRLFDGIKEREIYYKSVFVVIDKKGDSIISEGYTYGYLGRKIKEKNGTGYDSVMILEDGKYLSQHKPEYIAKIYARNVAMEGLVEKLKK